jgi:prepilin-type N-terminal cleavage/methylation domain-containing protein
MRVLNNEKGFTLIEIMVALFVFTVGILALNKLQLVAIRGNANANGLTGASSWAAAQVENLLALEYDDALLQDVEGGDGGEGLAGLDDNTAAKADGFVDSLDGNFRILWNVADDEPFRNIKTIRVIATRNYYGLQKQVVYDYYKINTF